MHSCHFVGETLWFIHGVVATHVQNLQFGKRILSSKGGVNFYLKFMNKYCGLIFDAMGIPIVWFFMVEIGFEIV